MDKNKPKNNSRFRSNTWEFILSVLFVLFILSGNLVILALLLLAGLYSLLGWLTVRYRPQDLKMEIRVPEEADGAKGFRASFRIPRAGWGAASVNFSAHIRNRFTGENVVMPLRMSVHALRAAAASLTISENRFGVIEIRAESLKAQDPLKRREADLSDPPAQKVYVKPQILSDELADGLDTGGRICVLFDNVLSDSLYLTPHEKNRLADLLFTVSGGLAAKGVPHMVCWMEDSRQAVMRSVSSREDLESAARQLAETGFCRSDLSSVGTFLHAANLAMFTKFYFVTSGDERDKQMLETMGDLKIFRVGSGGQAGPGKDQNV